MQIALVCAASRSIRDTKVRVSIIKAWLAVHSFNEHAGIRMQRLPIKQQGTEPFCGQGRQCADGEVIRATRAVDVVLCFPQLLDRGQHALQVDCPPAGQFDAAPASSHHPDAQMLLKSAYVLGNRPWRNAELFCGPSDASDSADDLENLDGSQGW
jgi:hypothetical protein